MCVYTCILQHRIWIGSAIERCDQFLDWTPSVRKVINVYSGSLGSLPLALLCSPFVLASVWHRTVLNVEGELEGHIHDFQSGGDVCFYRVRVYAVYRLE
jgi:hypothetical protein